MRFGASPWFSCHLLFFSSEDFWATSKGKRISGQYFQYIHTSEAFYYYGKPNSEGLDAIEIIIACNCFSAEGIDQVFNMTLLVGFKFASCENANLF